MKYILSLLALSMSLISPSFGAVSNWKMSQDGLSASRITASGAYESRLVSAIPATELTASLPADVTPMATLSAAAIAKTFTDTDAIYAAAVGNRSDEYKLAEQDALSFKVAGYAGICPASVSSWKPTSTLTNQQKADTIIAQAASLRSAITAMRIQRFASQDAMRNATTQSQLDTAVATWDAFIAATRAALWLK